MNVGELSRYMYAVTEIHRLPEDQSSNINVAGRGVVAIHFFSES